MDLELPKDFKEFFELLNAGEVRYLLIGGYAVGIYGYSRTTNDLDILIASDVENIKNLKAALFQFLGGETELGEILFENERGILEIGVEPMKIQILNFADGIEFEAAYGARNIVDVEDITIDTISKQDLIRNKTATGRFKDLADIERLERID
ncbi:MAG TPA: hypothetical protein PKD24_15670 [Pyrinomonadaceae bacterium]|nr:hypothetical protein [Pyrinomonadaceae bacterium]HMP66262.1 hypothetical protein [Pyrinomonadaceae bacterium]